MLGLPKRNIGADYDREVNLTRKPARQHDSLCMKSDLLRSLSDIYEVGYHFFLYYHKLFSIS